MVGGQRALARRELRGAHVAQLTRVHVCPQAETPRGPEKRVRLRHREGDVLAKCVHRIHEPGRGKRFQPGTAYGCDVLLPPLAILGRQSMQTQVCSAIERGKFRSSERATSSMRRSVARSRP